jgi:hypothetical protein
MGRMVVTELISVDGVVEAPTGTEGFERVGWTDAFGRGPEGDQFKWDETMASDALLLGRRHLRGLRGGMAVPRGRVRGQVQHDAQVRRLVHAREPRVEQHDRGHRRRRRRGHQAQAAVRARHRRARQPAMHQPSSGRGRRGRRRIVPVVSISLPRSWRSSARTVEW